jgi:hypothetical protein
MLRKKQLKSPYIPKIDHDADTSHFDVSEEVDDAAPGSNEDADV